MRLLPIKLLSNYTANTGNFIAVNTLSIIGPVIAGVVIVASFVVAFINIRRRKAKMEALREDCRPHFKAYQANVLGLKKEDRLSISRFHI